MHKKQFNHAHKLSTISQATYISKVYTMCMYPTGRKINEKVLRLKSNWGLIEI